MLEKITTQNISANNVKSTPGQRLTGTVSENKNVFDKLPELIAAAVNAIVDALQSATDGNSGADCINITPISGASGTTVQAILETLKAMLDDVYTKASVDDQLNEKADKTTVNLSVKSVSLVPETGVLVFTRQDGSTFQIDTLMEKILVNFSYEQTTQTLVFTASDGTVQRISIAEFVTVNEFVNSDTVSFSVSESGTVTANIKEGSITDEALSSALKTALIAYRDAAQTAATNAAASEANAGQYAATAAASATTAIQKATDATAAADNAAASDSSAAAAAKLSQSYAVGGTNSRVGEDTDNAKYYKEQAALSASNAATSESNAAASATTASQKATAAAGSAASASGAAATASQKADAAATSESNAAASASTASAAATAAATKANEASTSEMAAANFASAADSSKTAAATSATAAAAAQAATEQARDEAQEAAGGDFVLNTTFNAHANDTTKHITTSERTAWNNKVDKVFGKGLSTNDYNDTEKAKVAAGETHRANTDIHVTTADKANWNSKVDAVTGKGLSTNDYTTAEKQSVATAATHVANSEIHVTADEKAAWNAKGNGNCQMLLFSEVNVATSAWTDDTTYEAYPYHASILCTGVTADHIADITFSAVDAMSGNYAPVCETAAGAVYIYAAAVPDTAITVQIEARKAV